MMYRFARPALVVGALAALDAAPLSAQEPGCGYDQCALLATSPISMVGAPRDSLRRRAFSWAFVPYVAPLETARDPAHADYRRAQSLYRAATPLEAVAMAGVLGTIYYVSTDPLKRPWGRGAENRVLAITVGTDVLGEAIQARGAEHLSRAAWEYTRELSLPLKARPDGCTYDRCALRFRYGLWSTHLVQGIDGEPIADLRATFARAVGEPAAHYESYLRYARAGGWVKRIVLGSLIGGTTLLLSTNDKTAQGGALGLYLVGYAVGHLSLMSARNEYQELESAVWSYNATLPRGR